MRMLRKACQAHARLGKAVLNMTYQRLMSYMRKAIDEYHMIEDGDQIAIAVSGGKDSLTMALGLKGLQRFYPKHFGLKAFTVSLGFPDYDTSRIEALMAQYEIPYTVIKTDIAEIVFETRKEKNPCSLCAKMRKGALNEAAKSLGCNKVALGHNKEDVIESFLMSLIYEGRIHTFSPVTHWDRIDLYAIRPLLYAPAADVIGFSRSMELPILTNPCPADGNTKRQYIRQLMKQINIETPGTTNRMFRAILDSNIKGWH